VPSLQRKTDIDPKTGLFNSRFLIQALERELSRSIRFDRPLTIIMADMDLLRNINNTYGHLAGDEVLIGVANILQTNFREYDIVSRFGGEEFAILMPETTVSQAILKAEEIRALIEEKDFEISTNIEPIKVTMSFGIAAREGFEQSEDQILHNADKALYRAKLSGRNKVLVHADDSIGFNEPDQASSQMDHYQPTVPLVTRAKVGQMIRTASEDELDQHLSKTADERPIELALENNVSRNKSIIVFITAFALLSASLFLFMMRMDFRVDWFGLFTFTALAIFAEALSIDIYIKNSSVSTSAVPFIAGLLLYGPLSAGVIGFSIALVAWIKHHSPVHRLIFNVSNHVMGGLICSAIILLVADKISSEYLLLAQFLFGIILGGVLFFTTTGLISIAISLDKSVRVDAVWNENFRWLSTTYLAMGALGFCLTLSFQFGGLLGVVSIIAPLMILRLSQYQYLERTKELVSNLQSKNKELAISSKLINNLNEELLATLAEVIDLRDPFVLGHSQNVAGNASQMAKELGLQADQIDAIYKAGLLHDIGKIGVPEEILKKPSKLSRFEMEEVKKHSLIGAELVGKCHSLSRVVPIIRHHHEKFDGSGYPDGLRGTEIPIEARILAVADVVEAMSSDRPYRSALQPEDIIEELKKMSGDHLDPNVVKVFLKLVKTNKSLVFENSAEATKNRILENREVSDPHTPGAIRHPLPL
jgi:diguanylate cyclase (GGDEF)-like protein/putative nucleotidyltransferase with HDIG domain